MDFITPDWPAPAKVRALSTTRRGGLSGPPYDDGAGGGGLNLGVHVADDLLCVERNRALLRRQLPAEPVWLTQVHGSRVVDACVAHGLQPVPEADASITAEPGTVCAVQTADCLPVLFCDMDGKVVGASHAGWRGLAGGVLQNTLAAMRARGAGEIIAWLGPAIGPDAFEVGQDVLDTFLAQDAATLQAFRRTSEDKYHADIYALARLVLGGAGVGRIYGGGFCTVSDRSRFYSYRRDRVTGRMASLVWLE